MSGQFDLQGHRGARGQRPENTLPSFEAAFDAGVHSVETDVHLTRDGVAVLFHDAFVGDPLCVRLSGGVAEPAASRVLLSSLGLAELRGYRADLNPDPLRFPAQKAEVTPLVQWFAEHQGVDPYGIPTLDELFAFTAAYAGEPGIRAGKSDEQRQRARTLHFDLELKRVPFYPQVINDAYDGTTAGLLEERIVAAVRRADVVARTTVRSFDHRCVRLLRRLEPGLTGAVLLAEGAPVEPAELVACADAQVYCPQYEFLDAGLVRQVQAAGVRVLPWTVNHPDHWQRLLDWGVDGITTDFPEELAAFLRRRGVAF
jgi:glycerophosphoryl diester phosphodiesterase